MSSRRRHERRCKRIRFSILGTGVVGKTIAARLAGLGHDVMVDTRETQVTLSRTEPDQYSSPPFSAWQREHPEVKLGTFGDAAAHGEMVVNATAGAISLEALEQAGEENLNGKILIDISNPLDFSKGMPPRSRCRTPTPSASRSRGGLPRRGWSRPYTP